MTTLAWPACFDRCGIRPVFFLGIPAYRHAHRAQAARELRPVPADPRAQAVCPGAGQRFRTHTRRLMTVRTFSPKAADIQRQWHVIDASDVVLGRLASQAAT